MDDRGFFDLERDRGPTPFQVEFLAELRARVEGRLLPYCADSDVDMLFVVLDLDAPDVALVNVGLELLGNRLRGDRISVHDRAFPPAPTADGFVVEGPPRLLALRACALFDTYWGRPVAKHEWLHRGRVYANCHVFEDTGERLSQMYRSDWAPRGQEARLVAEGFAQGKGWIQTEGLGVPDRVTLVRGPQ